MTTLAGLFSAAALAGLAAATAAQTTTDFSGRWTTDSDPAAAQAAGAQANAGQAGRAAGAAGAGRAGGGGRGGAAGDLGSGWGATITITQDPRILSVEYAFFTRGDMQPPLKFTYALDGSDTKNSVMMGRGVQEETSRTAWLDEKLVITTSHPFINPANGESLVMEVKRTLSLESPATLIVETVRSGVLGGPPSTTRTVYRRL